MTQFRQTFEDRLVAVNRRPSGFDYLRLILASLVVVWHSINVTMGMQFRDQFFNGPARPLEALVLPMFFGLSGFLVCGSLERCKTLISFLGLRAIRLVPALAVETLLSAILIGAIFTNLPLKTYFTSPGLFAYALNIVGDIHFYLPGVFEHNPLPRGVNGQLWTLPFELRCYLLISCLAIVKITKQAWLMAATTVFFNVALFLYEVVLKHGRVQDAHVTGGVLVLCFLYGITFFLYRKKIIWNVWLFAFCTVLSLIMLTAHNRGWGDFLAALPVTYITAFLGLSQPRRLHLLLAGDYSYGIYLYGFPIQQAAVATMGAIGLNYFVNVLVSLPITVAVAMFSWWCVEKPSLRLRPHLMKLEASAISLKDKWASRNILHSPKIPPADIRAQTD